MEMRILVTGGTGILGREVVKAAVLAGYAVRIGSRRPRPASDASAYEWVQMDIETGEGVSVALSGVDCIVHAATNPRRPDAVDINGTRFVVDAAHAAGVNHFVHVSIIGIDRIPLRYYRSKLLAERIVASGAVPYSILRASQFHTLVDMLLTTAARVPLVIPIPTDFLVQSVAPPEVAERLLQSIAEGPGKRLPDFGGPEVLTLGEAVQQWKAARAERKRVMHVSIPGRIARALRAGENTAPDGDKGSIRWQDWVRRTRAAERFPAA